MKIQNNEKLKNKMIIFGGVIVILIVLVLFFGFPYWTADTVTITVTDKERIVKKNGGSIDSKYLVFTETEVFENTDYFVRFKFRSSDLQGRLKVGETYQVKVYGWRIPFLSAYRNIINITQD